MPRPQVGVPLLVKARGSRRPASHEGKQLIRDPIYGYVYFSDLESLILSTQLMLRLQHISQNGTTYLTYPSDRTSRFAHSLGAMHLASQMVVCALRNSEPSLRDAFLGEWKPVARTVLRQHRVDVRAALSGIRLNEPLYRDLRFGVGAPRQERWLMLLVQSVRLAALLHDLGHLPFSHVGETALQSVLDEEALSAGSLGEQVDRSLGDFLARVKGLRALGTVALHEKLSIAFGFEMLHQLGGELAAYDLRATALGCMALAGRILATREPSLARADRLLYTMHEVIASDLDADRLDYLRRDASHSGAYLDSTDVARLLECLQLTVCLRAVDDEESVAHYAIRPTMKALSAVEAAFLQRYQHYRWMIYHHNVRRADLALQRAIQIIVHHRLMGRPRGRPVTAIGRLAKRSGIDKLWAWSSGDFRGAETCHEPWLHAALEKSLRDLERRDRAARSGKRPEPAEIATLRACLQFFFRRRRPAVVPLWKRLDDYFYFAQVVQTELASLAGMATGRPAEWYQAFERNAGDIGPVGALNRELRSMLPKAKSERFRALQRWEREFSRGTRPRSQFLLCYKGDFNPADSLQNKYQLIYSSRFRQKPSNAESRLARRHTLRALVDLRRLSPVVERLNAAWELDIHLLVFWLPGPDVRERTIRVLRPRILDDVGRKFAHKMWTLHEEESNDGTGL